MSGVGQVSDTTGFVIRSLPTSVMPHLPCHKAPQGPWAMMEEDAILQTLLHTVVFLWTADFLPPIPIQ